VPQWIILADAFLAIFATLIFEFYCRYASVVAKLFALHVIPVTATDDYSLHFIEFLHLKQVSNTMFKILMTTIFC